MIKFSSYWTDTIYGVLVLLLLLLQESSVTGHVPSKTANQEATEGTQGTIHFAVNRFLLDEFVRLFVRPRILAVDHLIGGTCCGDRELLMLYSAWSPVANGTGYVQWKVAGGAHCLVRGVGISTRWRTQARPFLLCRLWVRNHVVAATIHDEEGHQAAEYKGEDCPGDCKSEKDVLLYGALFRFLFLKIDGRGIALRRHARSADGRTNGACDWGRRLYRSRCRRSNESHDCRRRDTRCEKG
ncbi:hypothetical protein EJ06DRAFT_308914 [Trichodelitschia bisporula]|uniref:Secreted protein n=1 Tax=Trichodelitschia bisporula TaxID=703511 RepID=A0A6G1I471_9PEZI|nr:hypothetical protein EJ06DRAFT_308914 [Trichodelitschia bisporula]